MLLRAARRAALLLAGAVVLGGCAGTLTARIGTLPDGDSLVRLVVSNDLQVIAEHCQKIEVPRAGPVMGCQMSRWVGLTGGLAGRAVVIVRYADSLPSAATIEIDAHELCHAIAAVQGISDPCHVGNGGIVQSLLPSEHRQIRWP